MLSIKHSKMVYRCAVGVCAAFSLTPAAFADPPPPPYPLNALLPLLGRPVQGPGTPIQTKGMVEVFGAPHTCWRGWKPVVEPDWLYDETRGADNTASLDTRNPSICWSAISTVTKPWFPPYMGQKFQVFGHLVHVWVDDKVQEANDGVITVVPQAGLNHACPAGTYAQAGGDAWLEPGDPYHDLARPSQYGYCWTPQPTLASPRSNTGASGPKTKPTVAAQ